MAKDQSEEITNFDLKDLMSYDELQTILNELMDDFDKVLKIIFLFQMKILI